MYQSLTIVGFLGKDPEMRYTPSGQPVTSFSVATSRKYKDNGGQTVTETTWFKITTWGNRAEVCNQYLHKGSKVLVEGRLNPDPATGSPRIWDRQDGSAGASYEVTASNVVFLSSANENGGQRSHASSDASDGFAGAPEEDIPF